MSHNTADANLLFGIIALQMDFISRDQLIAAMQAWVLDKQKSLAEVLSGQGVLLHDDRQAIESLVRRHLARHGDDPERSLAGLSAIGRRLRNDLSQIADPDVQASLPLLSVTQADSESTFSCVGSPTTPGGRFRILRPHARGGLGVVSVALDEELHREVAVKEILECYASETEPRTRFLLEAEITGGLEHPGIVPVYGLGHHPDGRPFYAMRFVRGENLKEAAARFHAPARSGSSPPASDHQPESAILGGDRAASGPASGARAVAGHASKTIELRRLLSRFLDVCNAIAYAHSRGVLHRDIKPGNILLGPYGETLVVDWGLAKIVGQDELGGGDGSAERTLRPPSASGTGETQPGSALGTPAYMSPEQAEGRLDLLGVASDVYSLGATLYYLLTGQAPFAGDAVDVISAVQRGEFRPPRQLDPTIDRALEAVCLKAMAHQPASRYPSCRALADDLDRYMADEPVLAWHEPLARRARRWARRNRTPVTAAGVALLVGVFGLAAVLTVQTSAKADIARALASEKRANTALARANDDLTRSQGAVEARYNLAVKAIETFHTGVSEDFLLKQPQFKDVRDRLLKSASDFYGELGALLGKRSDLASRRALWQANYEVATLMRQVGKAEDALATHRQVLAAREALAAETPSDPEIQADVGRSLKMVGRCLRDSGKTGEAEAVYRESVTLLSELPTQARSVREALANCQSDLAWLLHTTGRDDEALAIFSQARTEQEVLAATSGATARSRRDVAFTTFRIAILHAATGKTSAAESEYRKAVSLLQKLVDENPTVTEFRRQLADVHQDFGVLLWRSARLTEAEAECRQALALHQRIVNENLAVTPFRDTLAMSRLNFSLLLRSADKPKDAENELREALSLARKVIEDDSVDVEFRKNLALVHLNLGLLLSGTGRPSEAVDEIREALAIEQKLADDNPSVTEFRLLLAGSHGGLALALQAIAKMAEAETEYRAALEIQQKLVNENPAMIDFRRRAAVSHFNFGILLRAGGRRSEALAEYQKALAIQRTLAHDNPSVTDFQSSLARTHTAIGAIDDDSGQSAQALESFGKALAIDRRLASEHPEVNEFQRDLCRTNANIGGILRKSGQANQALESYGNAQAIYDRLASVNPGDTTIQGEVADIHFEVASIQKAAGRTDQALQSYGKALAIRRRITQDHPDVAEYESKLGAVLNDLSIIDSAQAHFEQARDRLIEARRWQEKALAANPRNQTYRRFLRNHLTNLIRVAKSLGRDDEANAVRRDRDELVATDPAMIALDRRLATVIQGGPPSNNAERVQLARRAYEKALYADSARLYAAALEADPKLADDRRGQHRYNAACAAALASAAKTLATVSSSINSTEKSGADNQKNARTGQSQRKGSSSPAADDRAGGAPDTPAEVARAKFRAQARACLEAELSTWTNLLASSSSDLPQTVAKTMEHWRQDTDLAAVRDEAALVQLPVDEREAWKLLWANVDAIMARARAR
jgi:eukaryotic-like serine/threonine-protein kinase